MKTLLSLVFIGFFSYAGFAQASPGTEKKPELIPSACQPNQICCYYNTHTPAGWDLKCLTREECQKLSGTIFDADKCLVVPEDKPVKKEGRKKK